MATALIDSEAVLAEFVAANPLAAVYFSSPDCGVCHVLKPKIFAMLEGEFSTVAVAEVDCAASSAVAGQQRVFAVPTLLLYFDGREVSRFSRNFSPDQVRSELERPYALFTE